MNRGELTAKPRQAVRAFSLLAKYFATTRSALSVQMFEANRHMTPCIEPQACRQLDRRRLQFQYEA